MALERTLSIIKPDAVKKNAIGAILHKFESNGLKVIATELMQLSKAQACEFYAVHSERPFYGELVDYMISGPVVVTVLEGDGAIQLNRKLMGATDPKKADAGTIRAEFGTDVGSNAVHGSDGADTAAGEVKFFFPRLAC